MPLSIIHISASPLMTCTMLSTKRTLKNHRIRRASSSTLAPVGRVVPPRAETPRGQFPADAAIAGTTEAVLPPGADAASENVAMPDA